MVLPQEARQSLLDKLNAHHALDDRRGGNDTGAPESTAMMAASDVQEQSELVLRLVEQSGKYEGEQAVSAAIDEYIAGKPLAYITGLHTFGSLAMRIRPPVYIPRVETEQWVLLLVEKLLSTVPQGRDLRILDVCSGSGCIPLLLAHQGKGRISTVGLEVDERALSVARENAQLNGISQLSTFEEFDLFEGGVQELQKRIGKFDIVISNPPYVSSADMKTLNGKWHEGDFALQGKLKSADAEKEDDDGLSFYRRILEIYAAFLRDDRPEGIPKCVLEVGATQSKPVQEMYAGQGRLEVYKETKRRMDVSTPKLEKGDMVGTERSLWVYDV